MTSSSITYKFRQDVSADVQRNRRFRSKNFEFIAVDGEGAGYGKDHRYVLLGCGSEWIENLKGIGWKEAFEFLYSIFRKKPSASFVGFFLGYDFTQIIKTLPEERARMLLTDRGINARKRRKSGGNNKPFPVRYDGWEFDMLPGRRLQIRPQNCRCAETGIRKCTHPQSEWMYICDSGPFWQCSLLTAIDPRNWSEPVVSPEEFRTIEAGKAQRSMDLDTYIKERERVIEYNRLENNILCRIMSKLRDGFLDIGVNLRKDQWFGPGQAAAAWYKANGIPRRIDLEEAIPPDFWESARQSYFGGWFEIFSHGIIPGRSYEYDINSAYPYIIAALPCLLHGRYSEGNGNPDDTEKAYTLVRARISGYDQFIGAALNRDKDGRIRRPRVTEGWYWKHEIDAGIRAGVIQHVEYREWKSYLACDCKNPVRGFRDLYEHRLAVGKDTVLGKSCKLVYNSGYGKFAQSTGSAPYGNWIYASLITAGCREMILDAIASHPHGTKSVLMVATDAVFFDAPHDKLHVSKNLGDWDCTERDNLTQFKPGVYWDDKARRRIASGEPTAFKARGINARDFAKHLGEIDALFLRAIDTPPDFKIKLYETENFTAYGEKAWPWIIFEIGFTLVSAKTALARGDWSEAGETQINLVTMQDSDPSDKREGVYYDSEANRLRTNPVTVEEKEVVSTPYDKRYGVEDPFSLDALERLGINQDGTANDVMRQYTRILSGEE
jgi:DNA polymerase type B, organellar and viral